MDEVKNIFFIDRFPITKEFFIRNEFEFLTEKGYNVQFLDISKYLKRQHIESSFPEVLEKFVIRFASKEEFNKFLSLRAHDSIIVSTVPFISSSAWMYYRIFTYSIPYILEENTSFPTFEVGRRLADKKRNYTKFKKKTNLNKILAKPVEVFYYYASLIRLNPAKMIITSKIDSKSIFNKLADKNTIVKYSLSPDYKLAKRVIKTIDISEPYAVFVDQYFVHHPDFKTNHIIHSFNVEQYYSEINFFLKKFKELTGLKVVIASHPRRNAEHINDFSEEFELYFNKTAELIKYSKIALIHFSTAVSFAVVFKKPFLLLNSSLFKSSNIEPKIKGFAKYFDTSAIDMSKGVKDLEEESKSIFEFNKDKYYQYKNQFLKHPKAINLTLGEKVLFLIDKLNNI